MSFLSLSVHFIIKTFMFVDRSDLIFFAVINLRDVFAKIGVLVMKTRIRKRSYNNCKRTILYGHNSCRETFLRKKIYVKAL